MIEESHVFVLDLSVLFDLEHGDLHAKCFQLPYRFVMPKLMYDQELADFGGPELLELGLAIESPNDEETELARALRAQHKSLSLPDAYALAMADLRNWTLLSGDRVMRQLSDDPHGVLWVIDRMEEMRVASKSELKDALDRIANHPKCRLPKDEIDMRVVRYSE